MVILVLKFYLNNTSSDYHGHMKDDIGDVKINILSNDHGGGALMIVFALIIN